MATAYEIRRAAIARSLLELEKLFGRKSPPGNDKGRGQAANVGTDQSELQKQHSTPLPNFQAAWWSK
jgi:hypothetical protein